MSENSVDLSILLTNSNQDALRNIQSFFKKMPIRYEIISLGEMRADHEPQQRVRSLSESISLISGKYVFLMDAKLKVPLSEVISFLSEFHTNPELQLLMGDRDTPKKMSHPDSKFSRNSRALINDQVAKYFATDRLDFFCPFQALRKEFAIKIFKDIQRSHLPGAQVLIRSLSSGQKVKSLSVMYINQESKTWKKLIELPTYFKMVVELLRLRYVLNRSSKE